MTDYPDAIEVRDFLLSVWWYLLLYLSTSTSVVQYVNPYLESSFFAPRSFPGFPTDHPWFIRHLVPSSLRCTVPIPDSWVQDWWAVKKVCMVRRLDQDRAFTWVYVRLPIHGGESGFHDSSLFHFATPIIGNEAIPCHVLPHPRSGGIVHRSMYRTNTGASSQNGSVCLVFSFLFDYSKVINN